MRVSRLRPFRPPPPPTQARTHAGTHAPLLGRLLDLLGVGHREVVAHHLQLLGHALGELGPRGPVVLVEGVLDRHDGELRGQLLVEVAQLLARDLLAAVVVLVLP